MGLETRRDHAANLFMTLAGRNRSVPRLMTGSHLNSVANGGNFDGAAGVIAGLVASKGLQHLGLQPHCDITTVAIRAEESVWFQVSYIGSRSAFGDAPGGSTRGKACRHGPHPCRTHGGMRRERGGCAEGGRKSRCQVYQSLCGAAYRAIPATHRCRFAGWHRHRGPRQLPLSRPEDPGRIRSCRSRQAFSP